MKKLIKKLSLIFFAFAGCCAILTACGSRLTKSAGGGVNASAALKPAGQQSASRETAQIAAPLSEIETERLLRSLDEIAELERAGSWLQGMAVTESTLREQLGDFPGAVAAAYKEIAFAYGRGAIEKSAVEEGLKNLLNLDGNRPVTDTANAILAFSQGKWEQALNELSVLFSNNDEPDSFSNWMILVCSLETSREPDFSADYSADRSASLEERLKGGYTAANAYRAIRARYAQFPEYWYRGARAFSGSIAAEFAENCINASPQGPFADECRKILAEFTGLKSDEGLSLRTKREIEALIAQSVNSNEPQTLNALFPLIGLPDNPYTVYAVNALKTLAGAQKFRDYFSAQAGVSSGRLAERLLYISRI